MKQFHLIGIKGAGMSSLANLLNDLGHYVQGSDVKEYFFTEDMLKSKNIKILPFNKNNIKKDFIIIVGNAFIDNEESRQAKKLGCLMYDYNQYLAKLCADYFSIAVSGSHGKTTTTNLIHQILIGKIPVNYIIGDGHGGGNKSSEHFIFEACEYKRNFLHYHPNIGVVTNIDYDHPDYYKDIDDVKDAFKDFINQSSLVVYNGDDKLLKNLIPCDKKTISFGLNSDNDYHAENFSNNDRYTYYDLYIKKRFIGKIKIPMFGIHSIYNSLCAIAVTMEIVPDINYIKKRLEQFKTGKRRFEEFVFDKQIIISDYAHHPKEIISTIEAVSVKYPYKKIVIYFQPHTFTRTITFLEDFAKALSLADKVYLREIFSSAREKENIISVNSLAQLIKNSSVINDESYIEEFKKINNSVIIFMGAGDIDRYCEKYIDNLKNNNIFSQTS